MLFEAATGAGRDGQREGVLATLTVATATARTGFMGYAARAKWSTVRIETEGTIYVGRVYVPETKKRLSDVLCDERPFILLTEVSVNGSEAIESFVAVSKRFVKSVRVLSDGEPDVIPMKLR